MRRSILALLVFTALAAFAATPAPRETPAASPTATPQPEEFVFFNVKSKKFHCASCDSARKCTKNCSYVERSKAVAAGGTACRACGGTCRH